MSGGATGLGGRSGRLPWKTRSPRSSPTWSAWLKPGVTVSRASPSGSPAGWDCRTAIRGRLGAGGLGSGVGLVCRWPMSEPQRRPLRSEDGAGFGEVVHVVVDGERGTIQLFAVVLDYPLDGSGIRQAQVKQLASLSATSLRNAISSSGFCGDFNAGPDSDEIQDAHRPFGPAESRPGVLRQLEVAGERLTWLHLVQQQSPWRPSACTPTGASTTSSRPGRGATASDIRSAARCSASACPTRTRYLTTTGWSRSFATEQWPDRQARPSPIR